MAREALKQFLVGVQTQFVPVVLAVDDAILRAVSLESAIKWSQLTYAVEGDFHHWLCAIAVTKRRVTLNFHFGALLEDPEGVFREGSSTFMRMLDFESAEDVDALLIGRRVQEAVSRLEYFKANWQRIQHEAKGDAPVM